MSVSESSKQSGRNWLPAVASVGGVFIGLFLLAGAAGHYLAVWPAMNDSADPLDGGRLRLLLPGLMLALPGLINIGVCRAVWIGRQWSINLLLVMNITTASYLAYQLVQKIPGHPIGFFLALVASYTLLLAAIRAGLLWPAQVNDP